ncbi:Hypothetical predicted protein, partial [Podarcis lilfordi]
RACVLCLVGLSPPPCICSLLWRFPQPTEADLGVAEGLQRGRDEGDILSGEILLFMSEFVKRPPLLFIAQA